MKTVKKRKEVETDNENIKEERRGRDRKKQK